jgi:hypothetical protein
MMSVLGSENGETEGSNECSSPVAVTEMGGRISSVILMKRQERRISKSISWITRFLNENHVSKLKRIPTVSRGNADRKPSTIGYSKRLGLDGLPDIQIAF